MVLDKILRVIVSKSHVGDSAQLNTSFQWEIWSQEP